MDTFYELADWLFGKAYLVFIVMVATVMTIGPWLLRKQTSKNLQTKGLWEKYLITSFCVGLISILLFYFLLFLSGRYINNLTEETLFFIVYFVILHLITVLISKSYFGKSIPVTTGWHLTVMSSLCTGIFFIIISGGIHRDMMEWEKGNQLEYVGNRLQVYIKDYQAYPERITDIFPQTRQHEDDVAIYTEKSGCVRVDDVKSNPCFKDLIHFFPLPENAPNDLLWLWVNPDQYYSTKMPVVLFDGSFRTIKKSELPALIERSRKWLAENPQPDKAPSTQKAK